MSDQRDLQQPLAFERWWDRLLRGAASSNEPGLDRELTSFARRVHALDEQASIDPEFKRELWEELMNAQPSVAVQPAPRFGVNGRAMAHPLSPVARPREFEATRKQGLASRGLSFAGAVALIAAVLAMIFFVFRNDHQNMAFPPLQGTPTVAPSVATPDPHAWPMAGGNAARTRNMPGPGPSGEPTLLWKYPAEGESGVGGFSESVLVADGVLYAPGSDAYVALDTATGKELWRAEGVGGIGVIDGDGIVLRSTAQEGAGFDLVRIRRSDGSVVWRAAEQTLDDRSGIVIAAGVGYIPSGNDLLAFDPATGAEIWRAPLDAPASRGAAVADGLLVLGDVKGKVYGLSTAGGDVVWTQQIDATTIGHAAIANGTAYFSAFGGETSTVFALDLATGVVDWSFPFSGPVNGHFYNQAVSETTVYTTGTDGVLYAIDAAKGSLLWTYQSEFKDSNSPILIGDTVYLSVPSGLLEAIDAASGAVRWSFPLDGQYSALAPIVVDGVAYIGAGHWMFAIGGSDQGATSSPIAAEATVMSTATAPSGSSAAQSSTQGDPVGFVWSASGDGQRELVYPGTVAVDSHGQIWVTSMPGSFFIFDLDGNLLEVWGKPGTGDGEFNFSNPEQGADIGTILFAPDGSFYIADAFNYRIQQFDANRNFVRSWGTQGNGEGQFQGPIGLVWDGHGNLLVADLFRNDIQRFSPDGVYLGSFGQEGTGPGEFQLPALIAVAANGDIWVPEVVGHRIQVFSNGGEFRFSIGREGGGPGEFENPAQVVFDDDGHAFVVDQFNHRIQVFDLQGRFLYQFGSHGLGEGQFDVPQSIAIYRGQTVIVVDYQNQRIEKFKITGPFPAPAQATPTP